MYPSTSDDHEFEEIWARVARLVPYAGMEDKLFWRRLEARKAALAGAPSPIDAELELLATLRDFEARLRNTLAVRLALLGDTGRRTTKVA
jgi:hypothetical protein